MPNWVSNTLRIVEGNPQEVWDAIRSDKSLCDFNRLIRMPQELARSTSEESAQQEKQGKPTWIDWAYEKWGAKYADDAEFLSNGALFFVTPWEPPILFFAALAKKFPNHKIQVGSSDCENGCFHYDADISNGELSGKFRPCLSEISENSEHVGPDSSEFESHAQVSEFWQGWREREQNQLPNQHPEAVRVDPTPQLAEAEAAELTPDVASALEALRKLLVIADGSDTANK
jgi:hypothetical protein